MSDDKPYQMIQPTEAWDLIQHNPAAVLVDVRSSMEFLMIGHPKGAIHVSWIDEPEWTVNPHFVAEIRKIMLGKVAMHEGKNTAPILLICRSNNRSVEAAELLAEKGFHDLFVVEGGFEGPLDEDHHRSTRAGWRFEGLPWEQC